MNSPPLQQKREEPRDGGSLRDTELQASADHNRARISDQVERRFAVYCQKHNGALTLFQRYATRREADGIAASLNRVGCRATVESTL